GTFKQVIFGTIKPTLTGETPHICAKVIGFRCDKQFVAFDNIQQIKLLIQEVRCLVWAQALLDMVYTFIDDMTSGVEIPEALSIPQMRFVEAALVVEQGDKGAIYLVEEHIRRDSEGPFKKYINNNSPLPIELHDDQDNRRADFLSFTQHVQYWLTSKAIILSDPQIITKP
ncbi:hypothetical protein CERSUDRAFT_40047, partial [Gelatoporia subvermispora B]